MKQVSMTPLVMAGQPQIIDLRAPQDFVDGFIKGSLYLSPYHDFSVWCRRLVDPERPILLVGTEQEAKAAAALLTALGTYELEGWSTANVDQWLDDSVPFDLVISVNAYELAIDLPNDPNMIVIDVSEEAQYHANHVTDAQHIALEAFADLAQVAALPELSNVYLYCHDGTKSATACSILKQHGLQNIRWVIGGMQRMKDQHGLGFSKTPKAKPKHSSTNED
jgi:hydroxyacylglutathione hydrolase